MCEIGIVIRTYNEAVMLPRTLRAIMGQTEQSFEIVLVDSGSTDATVEIARRHGRVKIIEIPKGQFTYGRALNIGIAALADRVKYISMLSAHAIPCNRYWLRELLAPMRHDPKIAGVYGKQVPLPEHLSNPFVRVLAENYLKAYGDKRTITNRHCFFSNANAAIRHKAWLEHKYDESLSYAEDRHWAMAVIRSGGRLAYEPQAAVYHSHADTYIHHFVRRYNEVKSFRIADPSRFLIIGKCELLRRIMILIGTYARESARAKSLVGLHSDKLVAYIVRLLATYKAGRDAKDRDGKTLFRKL